MTATAKSPHTDAEISSIGGGGGASVSDTVYGAGWNGDTTVAPSKNAIYDKIEAVISGAAALVDDTAYDASSWDAAVALAPSKNAVRDKIEAMVTAYTAQVSDTAYDATSWNAVTTVAPSKNAVRDKIEAVIATIPVISLQGAIADASTSVDVTGSDTVDKSAVETSLNDIGTKLNAVIATLVANGMVNV